MKFVTLTPDHIRPLLDFEVRNKAWFESKISARPDTFYSKEGVQAHVEQLIQQMNEGKVYAALVMENDKIIARANLKDIRNNTGYVGYRVGEHFGGRGVASFCMANLIKVAREELNLKALYGQVLSNNPASLRVLTKHNFEVLKELENYITLNGELLNCTELVLNDFALTQ